MCGIYRGFPFLLDWVRARSDGHQVWFWLFPAHAWWSMGAPTASPALGVSLCHVSHGIHSSKPRGFREVTALLVGIAPLSSEELKITKCVLKGFIVSTPLPASSLITSKDSIYKKKKKKKGKHDKDIC